MKIITITQYLFNKRNLSRIFINQALKGEDMIIQTIIANNKAIIKIQFLISKSIISFRINSIYEYYYISN